jgi:hypothetical protein
MPEIKDLEGCFHISMFFEGRGIIGDKFGVVSKKV